MSFLNRSRSADEDDVKCNCKRSPSPNSYCSSSSANQSSEDLRDLESMYNSPDSCEVLESLILVHVPAHVFKSETKKRELEKMFLMVDESSKFIYLKSFRRARVDFSSSGKAAAARNKFDGITFEGEKIRCYFAQKLSEKAEQFLKPPPLEKQFLISPPTSPAEGWIQPKEGAPKTAPPSDLGFDIATRLAGLSPNATHEVHHGNESQPSVFVHTAAQEAYAQPGNGRPNNDAEDEGLADLNGDEDEEEKETDPRPGHQGAIPKTPKPNYTPPNYVPK